MYRSIVPGLSLWLAGAMLMPAVIAVAAEDLAGLVDPTAPINVSIALEDVGSATNAEFMAPLPEGYTLNSVLIRSSGRIAVVNDQRVRVGDRVGAAIVSSIDAAGVVLDINGETTVLSLYGEPVKTLILGDGP